MGRGAGRRGALSSQLCACFAAQFLVEEWFLFGGICALESFEEST